MNLTNSSAVCHDKKEGGVVTVRMVSKPLSITSPSVPRGVNVGSKEPCTKDKKSR